MLSRFFFLESILRTAGSHPYNPDDMIKGTRTSGDKDTLLEKIELSRVMTDAGIVEHSIEWNCLKVEYTTSILAVQGPIYGENKLELLRRLCGSRAVNTAERYYRIVARSCMAVRKELESREWIPRRRSRSVASR